jgi:hypothetical protein
VDDRSEGGLTVTPVGRADRVKVTLEVGPRPLVAEVTDAQFSKIRGILADAVAAQERDDYSRIKLRDALRAAIGSDPFTQVTREDERDHQGLFPPWLGPILIVVGAGFAIEHTNILLRIAGILFALLALADVVRHGIRHWRGRS